MFLILVYDIEEERVSKILKTCRRYLNWVQNSVFEGDITEANLETLKRELKKIIKPDKDSIIIYGLRTTLYTFREVIGKEKGGEEIII